MSEKKIDIEIRPLRVEEAGEFAALQRRVFPEYNSSRLGHAFCARSYRQYALRDDAFGFGAWQGDKLLGVVTGCHQSVEARIHRSLLSKAIRAAAVRPHMLFKATYFRRVWHYLRRLLPSTRQPPEAQEGEAPIGEGESWLKIPTMGVAPEGRGLGVGTRLMQAAWDEGLARGFRYTWAMCAPANYAIHRVLEKVGWEAESNPLPDKPIRFWAELRAK